jgi:tRNA uridine 5-carbamoylmethylation protein Kti12
MSYNVIIRGSAGVGKTSIAKRLAGLISGYHISFDEIMRLHKLDRVSPEDGCIPLDNFIRGNEFALGSVSGLNAFSIPVIFDGCFYHKEQLDHLLKRLDGTIYVFSLVAPVEECVARDSGRSDPIGEESVRAVHSLTSAFEVGRVINTLQKTVDSVVHEMLGLIGKR